MNDRGYLDIAIVVPTGKTLDIVLGDRPRLRSSRSSARPTSATSSSTTRRRRCSSSTNGNTYVFRYWTNGHLHERLADRAVPDDERRARLRLHRRRQRLRRPGRARELPRRRRRDAEHRLPRRPDRRRPRTTRSTSRRSDRPTSRSPAPGTGDVASLLAATPTQLPGTSIFRFYVTGTYAPGEVVVTFAAGAFTSHHVEGTTDIHIGNLAIDPALHRPAADRRRRHRSPARRRRPTR